MNNKTALQFLQTHPLAVLATHNTDNIDLAPVYTIVQDDFTVNIVSPADTQKMRNIETNPRVSLAFVDEDHRTYVRIYGTAQIQTGSTKELLQMLATTLSIQEDTVVDILPLLKHTEQEKLALSITPTRIEYRHYTDAGEKTYEIELS